MEKKTYTLSAQKRETLGKKVSALRRAKLIPAVAYGSGGDHLCLTLEEREFIKIYREAGESSLINLHVDAGTPISVLIHDVQKDPILGGPLHVDFYIVNMAEKLTTSIPLLFIGESKAVKEQGGILVKHIDEVEVRCLPGDLVPEIEVRLEPLTALEAAVHIQDILLPTGLELAPHYDAHDIVVIVTPPVSEEELKKMEEEGAVQAPAEDEKSEEKSAPEDAK